MPSDMHTAPSTNHQGLDSTFQAHSRDLRFCFRSTLKDPEVPQTPGRGEPSLISGGQLRHTVAPANIRMIEQQSPVLSLLAPAPDLRPVPILGACGHALSQGPGRI